jgi:CDP-4-dehydro-6-deoxyglucose reductase
MEHAVTLKKSGQSFICNEDETLLDAALRQGIALTSGCRRGICGVCIGTLDSGQIEYADGEEPMAFFAEEDAEDKIVICEAMPRSNLVLDVQEIDSKNGLEYKNLQVEVANQIALSEHVIELELALPEDEFLQFLAGQIIYLQANEGQKLAFAPANAPLDGRHLTLHIDKRDKKNAQLQLTNTDQSAFRIEGPMGDFFLRHSKPPRPLIFIAEGTGFAAIKSMTEQYLARHLTTDLSIYWLGDSEEDLYQQQLVNDWVKHNENINFNPLVGTDSVEKLMRHLSEDTKMISEHDIYISATATTVDEIEFEMYSLAADMEHVYYYRY